MAIHRVTLLTRASWIMGKASREMTLSSTSDWLNTRGPVVPEVEGTARRTEKFKETKSSSHSLRQNTWCFAPHNSSIWNAKPLFPDIHPFILVVVLKDSPVSYRSKSRLAQEPLASPRVCSHMQLKSRFPPALTFCSAQGELFQQNTSREFFTSSSSKQHPLSLHHLLTEV